MKQERMIKFLEWLIGPAIVAATTVFAVMRFAYSDFETQRTSDLTRSAIEKRLDSIQQDVRDLASKVDRLLDK